MPGLIKLGLRSRAALAASKAAEAERSSSPGDDRARHWRDAIRLHVSGERIGEIPRFTAPSEETSRWPTSRDTQPLDESSPVAIRGQLVKAK